MKTQRFLMQWTAGIQRRRKSRIKRELQKVQLRPRNELFIIIIFESIQKLGVLGFCH